MNRSHAALRAVWRLFPESIRRLTFAQTLKHAVRGADPPAPAHAPAAPPDIDPVRVIETLAELDDVLRDLDRRAAISDDELRAGFERFRMRASDGPSDDPDSEAYRARQFALYERIAGRPYTPANEVSTFDPIATADRPFPYQTASASTVGGHLIAIGFLIRQLGLRRGSSVLEFGPGWGNLTLALARMGHRVTAVDVEANFVKLIDERSRRKNLAIETIHGDFSLVDHLDRTFDVVLFFESFHHCANHQALVASLDRVVAPGGQVVFAGEPIYPWFPQPWGLRLDGESLWQIRRQGWLELGFREDYFLDLLARCGWTVTKSVCRELEGAQGGWGTVFVAKRTAASGSGHSAQIST